MKKLFRAGWLILGITVLLQLGCGKKTEEERPYQIRLKTAEKMVLVYVEHTGSYDRMGEVFVRIGEYAAQKALTGDVVGIYYDDPEQVPAEQLRSEIGIVVPQGTVPDSGYILREIPKQKVVYAILRGPYGEIAKEYPHMMQWMEEKGYQVSGPLMEIYLEAGPDIPPEDLVTEIRIPIKE